MRWHLVSDAVAFKSVKFSDNRMASFNAMNLENGLVVGDTTGKQNINEGFVTYKSKVVTKKVTFANFEAYALRTFLAGPEGARFQTEAINFFNIKIFASRRWVTSRRILSNLRRHASNLKASSRGHCSWDP
jgi:hypothetical protein